jgi:ergothioneine biosynthesis protein EgtB
MKAVSVASCPAVDHGASLEERYRSVRRMTEWLCEPLSAEDAVVQSMPDASPTKWHLAHTTWFFETFLLESQGGYESPDPLYRVLFNSYYNAVGEQHPRPRRGVITRPGLDEVRAYRRRVDEGMLELIASRGGGPEAARLVEIGLHHEQQHQELILMDVKHLFSCNPSAPAYRAGAASPTAASPGEVRWIPHEGGVVEIGHSGAGFAYDNEQPRHRVFLEPFEIASRPVANAEFLAFVEDDGYRRPELWLDDGWSRVREAGWQAPAYWRRSAEGWTQFTLSGERPLVPAEPVCHVSHYEADAFARWAGARLPTEAEWEATAAGRETEGNFVESGSLHPVPAAGDPSGIDQLFGDVWEWTSSPYVGYPGFAPPDGALGEYNGKFMSNQMVLRGGCCATSRSHIRTTYRNFFYPHQRWQFAGLRLAR